MLICIPLKSTKPAEALKTLKSAQKIGDLVEIWQKTFHLLGAKVLNSSNHKPTILKIEDSKQNFLNLLSLTNIHYIDLDYATTPKLLLKKIKTKFPKLKIITSFHDFKKTPPLETLKKITRNMQKNGADIIKIATFAKNFKDSLIILELLNNLSLKKQPAICLAMGENGKFTRIAGQFLGNYLMYAPLKSSEKTASGQLTAKQIKALL